MKWNFVSAGLILSAVCALGQQRVITEYSVTPRSAVGNVCMQPNGNVWLIFSGTSSIGTITPEGKVTSFRLPLNALPLVPMLVGCAFGPDGRLYFSDQANKKTLAFDPASHRFSVYSVPAPNTGIAGLAFGEDGNAWIMITGDSAIQRMTVTGIFLPVIQLAAGRYPHGPSICPDGNIWIVEVNANRVARLSPSGGVTELVLPQAASKPFSTACGPDGVYFSEGTGRIGRVDYETLQITQWKTPNAQSNPTGIAVSNGSVYFAEADMGKIGVMPVGGGTISEYPIPLPGVSPDKLTTGADGRVWFSQQDIAFVGAIN
jgi:virginiamycin B lyase